MAETHKGSWYPLINEGVQWDAQGKPYYKTSDGLKAYIPPSVAAQELDNPKLIEWAAQHGVRKNDDGSWTDTSTQRGGLIHGASAWDSQAGEYSQPINWGNIMALGVGGAIAAPFAAGALGSLAAGSTTAVAPTAVAPVIPTTMGIGSATSLGLPVTAGLGSAGAAAGGAAAATLPATVPASFPAAPAAAAEAVPGAVLPSTQIGTGMMPAAVTGGTGVPGLSAWAQAAQTGGGGGVNWQQLLTSDNTIGTIGQLAGGYLNTRAAQQATEEQASAARYAADLQDAAQRRTEQFLREQAQNQYSNSEASRRGNYDQWRARENRFSTLSRTLGAGARQIPDYVPGIDPRYTNSGSTASGPSNAGAPLNRIQVQPVRQGVTAPQASAVPNGDYQAWFNNLVAGKPFTQQTLLDLEPTLNAAGVQLTPPNAVGDRTKIGLPNGQWVRVGFGEGKPVWIPQNDPSSPSPPTTRPQPTAYQPFQYQPTLTQPLTPALGAPMPMPGTLAALAQQQQWFY